MSAARSSDVGPTEDVPRRGDWPSWLGHRVRAYWGSGGLAAEGEVIAVCEVPTVIIRRDDGTVHHHASSLPMEVSDVGQPMTGRGRRSTDGR